MADNVTVTPSASYTVAADDIGGIGFQRVKIALGADGVNDGDVNALNPMPVSGAVGVSGTVTIAPTILTVNTAGTVAGASVTAQVSGTVTVLDGASVTIQQGASVVAQVSGTVTIAPTTLTVNTAAAATTVISGAVSISAMPAVSISVSAVLGTIITQLGTQMVSMAQTSVSVAAVPTVQSVLTIITQLGTQMVSIAQTSVSIAALPTVNTVQTIITILGTQIVSVVPGFTVGVTNASVLVGTTATPAADGSGLVVWVANPGAAVATTVLTVSTVIGQVQVSGTVTAAGGAAPTNFLLRVTATTGPAAGAGTSYLMTIWTGIERAGADLTQYVIPAGKTLRIQAVQFLGIGFTATQVLGFAEVRVVAATASASLTSANIETVGNLAVLVGMFSNSILPSFFNSPLFSACVGAGTTIGVFMTASTRVRPQSIIVQGYLY